VVSAAYVDDQLLGRLAHVITKTYQIEAVLLEVVNRASTNYDIIDLLSHVGPVLFANAIVAHKICDRWLLPSTPVSIALTVAEGPTVHALNLHLSYFL
jgi:hypothetical protein